MSSYTTQLRYLIESGFDIGLKDYPIFDEDYREILNNKIINHYYFREIGLETAQLFKLFLNNRMNEIMKYYNQLYLSELIEIEPLTRLDWQESYDWHKFQDTTRTTQNKGNLKDVNTQEDTTNKINNSNTESTTDFDSKNVRSDTPNGKLDWDEIENELYATEVNIGKDNTIMLDTTNEDENINYTRNEKLDRETLNNVDDEFSLTDEESYIKRYTGNNAVRTDSQMLMEFRETFLNIDMMIINELEDLFIQLW